MNLFYKNSILVCINQLMHGSEYVSDFLVVFADETDIWADTLDITVNDVTEFIRFICSLDNGMILVLGIGKPKACSRFNGVNNLLLVCLDKGRWGGISFQ